MIMKKPLCSVVYFGEFIKIDRLSQIMKRGDIKSVKNTGIISRDENDHHIRIAFSYPSGNFHTVHSRQTYIKEQKIKSLFHKGLK